VFLFNHGDKVAKVEFSEELPHPATRVREIIEGKQLAPNGKTLQVRTEVPAQGVRIIRIEY